MNPMPAMPTLIIASQDTERPRGDEAKKRNLLGVLDADHLAALSVDGGDADLALVEDADHALGFVRRIHAEPRLAGLPSLLSERGADGVGELDLHHLDQRGIVDAHPRRRVQLSVGGPQAVRVGQLPFREGHPEIRSSVALVDVRPQGRAVIGLLEGEVDRFGQRELRVLQELVVIRRLLAFLCETCGPRDCDHRQERHALAPSDPFWHPGGDHAISKWFPDAGILSGNCGRRASMSIDLTVYSERPEPVQRAALAQALQRKGWHALFIDQGSMQELGAGAVDLDLVYGAKNAPVLKTVKDLLAGGAEQQLEALFADEEVGGCAVSATVPFDAGEEFGDELDAEVGPEIAQKILRAKSYYHIGTSAGRSDVAFRFQEAVWKTLGELVGGLLEDPQTGKYIQCGPKGEEVLAEVDDSEGSPIGGLKKYFDAAKAAGFPVEGGNDDVNLNTAKLSQTDLERLLKFTREYFPKEDPSGSAMVMMILEEYQQKK